MKNCNGSEQIAFPNSTNSEQIKKFPLQLINMPPVNYHY